MLKRLGYAVLSAALTIAAFFFFQWGFAQLSDVRQLDRLPMTPLSALAEGVYAVEGIIEETNGTITAPYSKDKVVYYSYKLEEEYRDSEGNTKTRTLDSGQSATSFNIKDTSSSVTVSPGFQVSEIEWTSRQTHRQKSGKRTYTEYTLRQGEAIQLLGWYNYQSRQFDLSEMKYNLESIVTYQTLKNEGGETLLVASLLISLASGFLAVGLAALLVVFGVHRYWVFVVVMTAGMFAALWSIGTMNLRSDWDNAATLYAERSVGVYAGNRVDAIEDLYAMYALIKRSANQWPDSLLFKVAEKRSFQPPSLDDASKARIESRLVDIGSSKFSNQWVALLIAGISVILTAVLIWAALRAIRFKRLVEFIPTSKSTGLAYGIAELFGMIEVDDKKPFLSSRYNQKKCVAYTYLVEERRGSGKNAKWVTVEEGGEQSEFWLEDSLGRVAIDPTGANIVYPEKNVDRDGRMKYTEHWLPPYRNVYCLGFAGIANADSDKLSIQKSDDFEYLITTQEEEDVVKSRGASGFMLTGLALGFSLVAGTVLLSSGGMLGPMDLITVSLIVPLTLMLITAILHYNGIIFLKNRVDKTRADIDTLLQRRHDLWPQLINTVKGFMAHEKKLMAAMGKIRSGQSNYSSDPDNAAKQIKYEKKVVNAVIARVEAYPDLKSNTLVQTFSKQMERTEDELALIRKGYNDSVELYNTQIEKLPDVILAKMFGFKAANLFSKIDDAD
jgi:hypothetical protein